MTSKTKLGIWVLLIVAMLVGLSVILKGTSKTYTFDFGKTFSFQYQSSPLRDVVARDLAGKRGTYAIYVENLQTTEKYALNESEIFPAASLYKLILMAAVLKEVEAGNLKLEDEIYGKKSHLIEVLGEEDFGYEEVPESIAYTVDEALTRVGRISDNFAAIMLTEKLRQLRVNRGDEDKLLIQMTKDLGMDHTDFESDPIDTTASDIAHYFKLLYGRQVVSPAVSEAIIKYLSLSNINDRIPASLPEEVKVVHKTGELAQVRHDAGFVEPSVGGAYVIVIMSKDVVYEDDGVDTLAQVSKDVYQYFVSKEGNK